MATPAQKRPVFSSLFSWYCEGICASKPFCSVISLTQLHDILVFNASAHCSSSSNKILSNALSGELIRRKRLACADFCCFNSSKRPHLHHVHCSCEFVLLRPRQNARDGERLRATVNDCGRLRTIAGDGERLRATATEYDRLRRNAIDCDAMRQCGEVGNGWRRRSRKVV